MNDQMSHYRAKLEYEIDPSDLKAALAAGERIVVIDARTVEAHARERIPGSVNIPHRTMTRESVARIDKTALVVTYCEGIGCNASTKGALKMLELGFRVKELIGGIEWWKKDGYDVEGAG